MPDQDLTPPPLKTERLWLLAWAPEMAPAMAELLNRNRERFVPFMPRPPGPITAESCLEQIREACRDAAQGRALRLVMDAKDDPARFPMGTVAFTHIARGPLQAAHLGY